MKHVKEIRALLSERLKTLAKGDVVVTKPISVGDRHVLALCELDLGFGAGGGEGEEWPDNDKPKSKGAGGGVGGGAKATPIAVIVAEGDKVRIETL